MGNERPKKRQRDSDDPFDLDRFIFPVNGSPNVTKDKNGSVGSPNEYLTPDLNREVVIEGAIPREVLSHEEVVCNDTGGQRFEEGYKEEVADTIHMAKVLGVSNIENFEGDLEKVINDEGFQSGDK